MNDGPLSSEQAPAEELTWRELEVLELLDQRLTNREIAGRLHLAESTVKDYVGRILAKLYVKNRRQAVTRARALGLLDGDRPAGDATSTLPAETTPFVGRRLELEDIKRRLSETRQLTLVGPGGMGKTRLALKVAQQTTAGFPDGRYFVALAPIQSADHLLQTIAEALRFPLATDEDPRRQLLRYLKNKRLLLVLDNFEHLLDGAPFVGDILSAAPEVAILATSRERLNLLSESIFAVDGMAYPRALADPGDEVASDAIAYDAVALFLRRADKVSPGFSPSAGQLHHLVDICRLVGGMPLAIELAAAWMRVLRPDEIAAELRHGLDILATDARDAPARHRDIRAVFDHSWSLLDEDERHVLMPLSVFRGGFTRDAAEQVAGATLLQLAGLVNQSFLSHDPDAGRFEFHELLRQYVYERLAASPEPLTTSHQRHAAYYAALVQRCWTQLKGPEQLTALAEMEADIENVRAAWRFYLDQTDVPQLERLVNGLYQLYWIRGWNLAAVDFLGRAAAALADQDDEQTNDLRARDLRARDLRALILAYRAYSMAWLGQNEAGHALALESAALLAGRDRPLVIVFAQSSLDVNAYFLGRLADERAAVDKMLAAAARSGDKWLQAYALYAASLLALKGRRFADSRRLAQANLALSKEIGDAIGSALPLIDLGHVALALGQLPEARDYYRRSLAISETCGFHYGKQSAGKYLAKVTLSMGRLAEAEELLHRCLAITSEAGFIRDVVNLLYEFGRLRLAQGRYEEAAELLALVLQHPDSAQSRLTEGPIRDSAADLLPEAQANLPPETYQSALTRGRRQNLDAVVTKLTAEG